MVFRDGKGGAALETLAWEAGHCVGYQEEFVSGDTDAGAYVCHLTIAAPQLTMQPGGPASYRSPAPSEHGSPQQALVDPFLVPLLTPTAPAATTAGEAVAEVFGGGLATVARTASLTLGFVLMPSNRRDDPGYAAEWELYRRNNLHLTPVTPDQLRLAQLEQLHAQGDLTPEEEAELIALLGKVKGIHVQGLAALNELLPSRPTVRDATETEAAEIARIRKKHIISKKKNVAYASGILDGKPYSIEAHSGIGSKPGTAPTKDFKLQRIKTKPTSADIARGVTDSDVRAYDSEVKILEDLLDSTMTNPNVSGTIKVVSERPICDSCWDGISQVEKLRPNIKIERVQLPKN